MDWATDVWEIDAESATRVGHPAPFPVELPQRLIELYTYRDDLVLDPFMGAGSTAVAAVRTHRHYVGFDIDEAYVRAAKERVADRAGPARASPPTTAPGGSCRRRRPPPIAADDARDFQARAAAEGLMAKTLADELLVDGRASRSSAASPRSHGVEINFVVRDQTGTTWNVDVSGAFTKGNDRAGLRRTDTLWKALGQGLGAARVARETRPTPGRSCCSPPTSRPGAAPGPRRCGPSVGPDRPIFDAIEMLSAEGQRRLRALRRSSGPGSPSPELWPATAPD